MELSQASASDLIASRAIILQSKATIIGPAANLMAMIGLMPWRERSLGERRIPFEDWAEVHSAGAGHHTSQPRSRTIRGELVDVAVQIDLYKAALWRGIEAMRDEEEGQILGTHAGIIETGYEGLQIREGITRCADCGQSQHDCNREQT
jgi:hypothetical protein